MMVRKRGGTDMHDLVIRGGTVVDGTGTAPRTADVAISGGRVAEVGSVSDRGRREVDADGALVTPGFVDVHTHYDGQATWDPWITPSSWLGVTTVVMGNCGVGFAPADPARHDWLIGLMEGVEDIPGTALAEGIKWGWESFPEYMDVVEASPHAIDVGAQIPHGALRAYVMGERGADHESIPTPDEIHRMYLLVKESIEAGALGFTSSRTRNHRTRDGALTPSLTAGEDELVGIARALGDADAGVFEFVADFRDLDTEFALLRELPELSGRPMSISIAQADAAPDQWRRLLELIEKANAEGVPVRGQVAARGIGLLLGLQGSLHPFITRPAYREIADLPLDQRVARMRDPEVKARILTDDPTGRGMFGLASPAYDKVFLLGDPPNYEPAPKDSIGARARREGRDPDELAYELVLDDGGKALLYLPFLNYTDFNLDNAREMLLHPFTVPGLGDGGAHCGVICDGSFPTYLLTHWARDRTRGEKLPVEWVAKAQCADTAALVGLHDRGVLAPGMKGDVNVIDFDALRLRPPRIVYDLPAGGRRLIQEAEGILATFVSGEAIYEKGEKTGALPGKLIRGAQHRPT
jgi:N-acyl-D-aspartate/D-glutamate deacylase